MPGDDDELSCLRALADDFILDVAERDPARVSKVIADVCERLATERHLSWAQLETAVEVLLLEWQDRLSGRAGHLHRASPQRHWYKKVVRRGPNVPSHPHPH